MTDKIKRKSTKKRALKPQPPLPGYARKYLRGLAHSLKPIVQIGQQGITESVVDAISDALLDHELIKVRMHEPEDKKAMSAELAKKSYSELVGLVGHCAILYRKHPDDPQIKIPKKKREE